MSNVAAGDVRGCFTGGHGISSWLSFSPDGPPPAGGGGMAGTDSCGNVSWPPFNPDGPLPAGDGRLAGGMAGIGGRSWHPFNPDGPPPAGVAGWLVAQVEIQLLRLGN